MDGVFLWLLVGSAALLVTAAAVAWWEHQRRSGWPVDEFASPPRAARVDVDVEIDRLPELPAEDGGGGDSAARRDAVGGAMARARSAPAAAQRRNWIDTAPMVGPGMRAEPPPRPHPPREFESSERG